MNGSGTSVEQGEAGSWADRLSAWVATRSLPETFTYGVAWVIVFGVLTVTEWQARQYPIGTFYPLHAVVAAGIVAPIWLTRIFNTSGRAAMRRVRPLLALDDSAAARLAARLTSTPVRLEIVATVFWLSVTSARIAADPTWWVSLNLSLSGLAGPIAVGYLLAFVLVVAALAVKIAYMGSTIWSLSRQQLSVSLWELGPLHGFSILTAQFAGSLIALAAALYLARPALLSDPLGIAAGIFGVAFAAGIFVVPLLGIHDRLVAEKGRLRGEAARTMEAALLGLHEAIKTGDLAAMDAHYKAIAAVEIEMRTLAGIPTWPWSSDTFRWVVGALMFPLVLFVIQFVITQVAAAGSARGA